MHPGRLLTRSLILCLCLWAVALVTGPLTFARRLSMADFLRRLDGGQFQTIDLERYRAYGIMIEPGQGSATYVVDLPATDEAYAAIIAEVKEPVLQGRVTLSTPNPTCRDLSGVGVLISGSLVLIPSALCLLVWLRVRAGRSGRSEDRSPLPC